jgi:Xaa-Pro aminopeptidase
VPDGSPPARIPAFLEPLGEPFRAGVRATLAGRCARDGFDGLLCLATWNVVHVTGFLHSPNERPVGVYVPVSGEPVLFVPFLEKEHAEETPIRDVRTYPEFPGVEDPILWMIRESGARRLAVDDLPARLLAPAGALVERLALSDMVREARAIKTPAELAFVREASAYADLVLETILHGLQDLLQGHASEVEIMDHGVSAARAALIRDHGSRLAGAKMGITASVHAGARAALPHGKPGAAVPKPGDTLIAGIGCSLGGYHAESGATFLIGAPSADQARVIAAMEASNQAAKDALRPGARCDAVNAAALAPIRAAGLAPFIRHRIGHGMGVEGHEAPWLAPGDGTRVAAGMVFSNEPGVYRPGLDGWRTIDTMIATDGAPEVPSRFQARFPFAARVVEP